jgi:hypothetical protein
METLKWKSCLAASLFLVCACASAQTNANVASVIGAVNIDSLSLVVKVLTGVQSTVINGQVITIKSRDHETAINYPAEYLRAKLASYGYAVTDQDYGVHGRNVYAKKPGAAPGKKYVVICAHYDAFPYASQMPAADDNATGVATVMEAARILKGYANYYPILFAFWDEEEVTPGMFGSRHYVDSVLAAKDSIGGVIDFEMLGWDGNNDNAMTIHAKAVGNSVQLAQTMADVNAAYGIGLVPAIINPGDEASDHASFWNDGYGALMEAPDGNDFNPNYHSSTDTFASLNLRYFHKMAKLGIGTLAAIAQFSVPLPVELSSFAVHALHDRPILEWTTATEVNDHGFDIERAKIDRASGQTPWMKIGFVEGNGTSQSPKRFAYSDLPLPNGTYAYRLVQIDNDGVRTPSIEARVEIRAASAFALNSNYPNPFNPSTHIRYSIGSLQHAAVTIFDVMGRTTATLVDEMKEPGHYEVRWDAQAVPSGIYFVRLVAGTFSRTEKILLQK